LIGIDVGGSFIKGGLVSSEGKVSAQLSPEPSGDGLEVVATVRRMVASLQDLAEKLQAPVEALGISTCGVVDPHQGEILENMSIPGYSGTIWGRELADLKLPLHVENDARAAAWAEFQARDNREIDNWIHLPIGTNIGSGIIVHGQLWRGSTHGAGEIGHITVDENGSLCACGNVGCLEGFVSKRGIFSYVEEALSQGRESLIVLPSGDRNEMGLQRISAAEAQGDALAHEAFQSLGRFLGVGLTTLVNLFNPSVITIGGGTPMASPTILDTARRYVNNHALRSARTELVIKKGKLGNEAGFIGAALLAQSKATQF
jgi:glucokinase